MLYARIKDGTVREIINDNGKDINDLYHADIIAMLVPDPKAEAVYGSTWNGTVFGAPPVRALYTVEQVRKLRDQKLSASDWTQGADAPITDEVKAKWVTYRQDLRDLPASYPDCLNPDGNAVDDNDIKWPTKP
tara:strand:- start:1849 stop:2247 length:399 start_codon:yes stop_codon:yes gene_type:complete